MVEPDDNLAGLRAAIRRRFGAGAEITNFEQPTLGGSSRTILFDLVQGASRRRLVSRQVTVTGAGNPFLPAADQFRVMNLVHCHGFPVPEPVFGYDAQDGLGEGFVCAAVSGETMPKRLLAGASFTDLRGRLAAQCGELLARLHATDPAEADFLAAAPDSADPLAAQASYLDSYGEAHPAIEFGLRWLVRNRPPPGPRVLLHGDFRIGNLMIGPEGIRAVLDWEGSHLGTPAEDLGWLCTRSWRFGHVDRIVGGFGTLDDLLRAYTQAGGRRIDPEEVRYWSIFGLARWAVLNVMQAYGHMTGARASPVYAACGRNTCLVEYDLLMTLAGHYQ
ncbi:MAG: phosphotransferase family protein [Pseudomonadota bacterium]|nr:phosphotransferase family protein [Pseudomonadota bacterium]